MSNYTKKQMGFTLIEFIIVILIIGIISAMASRPLQQGYTAYITSKDIILSDWQARYALERMARDLRMISSTNAISAANSNFITFTNFANASITYSLSGSQLFRNANILANNIASITFTYLNSAGDILATPVSAANRPNIRYITITLVVTFQNAPFTTRTAIYTRITS